MNRLNKTESAVFLYFRFFLFLKDPFFMSLPWKGRETRSGTINKNIG